MSQTMAGAITKAILHSFILKRQERIEREREREKQASLSRLSGRAPADAPGAPGDGSVAQPVADPGSRLRELADQESCGTCRKALLQLLRKPPEKRQKGLEVYEEEYLEAKQAYMEGEGSEAELRDATTSLLETADML